MRRGYWRDAFKDYATIFAYFAMCILITLIAVHLHTH